MTQRKPFVGSRRGLVLAIDIGTTYSGISYSVLDPGAVPEIKGVTRFPAQISAGSSKIPSVLYYDSAGLVRAIGAETLLEVNIEKAEDEQWTKVEWFKLHLKPKTNTTIRVGDKVSMLPPNKSLVEIFADFLEYLFFCSKTFIQETVLPDGPGFWASVENDIKFVLSHPNGWEGAQQSHMRRAAVLAGLVSNDRNDQDRIQFVTEGEASLHFCINSGLTIKENEGVIIVDCGGGTIDVSAYSSSDSETMSFEEISRSECCFSGSIFVTEEARKYFREKLQGSRFYDEVPRITECFDQSTKLQFRDNTEPSYVKFGGLHDREPALNIQRGLLAIEGSVVARFFQPSVKSIIKAVVKQRSDTPKAITSVFLVGGFAASAWLFSKLQEDIQHLGLSVHRPDTHVNKAVSDGAVSFFLDHFVTKRVSRSFYGIRSWRHYDRHVAEHRRRGYVVDEFSGYLKVEKGFTVILRKDTQVSEEQEYRESFSRYYKRPADSRCISINILKYQGADQNPSWIDVDSEMYSTVCTVTADTSAISLSPLINKKTASTYYQVDFDVLLLFGLTELKAQIAWKEKGVEKRSRAEVVYEES